MQDIDLLSEKSSSLFDKKGKADSVRHWVITTFFAALITLGFSVAAMVFSLDARNSQLHPVPGPSVSPVPPGPSPGPPDANALPWRFVVDDPYILPPTDQKNVGTCWCFSMIYGLESQYRAQGIRAGLLKPNEYVSFSKQAWLRFLHEQCLAHPEVKACHYGGLLLNSSEDQEVESLWYFYNAWPEEVSTHLLPESVCEYLPAPPRDDPNPDYFKCPGYTDALKNNQNPIKWSIKGMSLAYTIEGAKELLVKVQRALGFGTPLPNMVYYIPCDGSPFSNFTDCLNGKYPCPEYIEGDYCHKLEIDSRENDGIFLGTIDPKFMSELGGHAIDLLGYNDDWVYRNRFQSSQSSAQLKGGFVLHNSWRSNGHSVKYLMGNESEENEAVICPNHGLPMNWIPASYECVYNQSVAKKIRNFLNCSDTKRIRGKGLTNGSDLLYCHSDHCNRSLLYVLAGSGDAVDAQFLPSGLVNVSLITIDNNTIPYTVGQTKISSVPFWALSQWFSPIAETYVPNEWDSCGYWMLPYQTMENILRINWDLLDNFRVVDIEVEFDLRSYTNSGSASGYNYSLLRSSTKTLNTTTFDGPLPYQYIY